MSILETDDCKSLGISWKGNSVWNTDLIVNSPYKDVEIPDVTIVEYVRKDWSKWSNETAVVCGATGRKYTYAEVFECSDNFAANLRCELGIRNGDIVAILLPNIPEYAILVLGILHAGGVVTAINYLHTAYEISEQLKLSNPKIIITLPESFNTIEEANRIAETNSIHICMDILNNEIPEQTISYLYLISNIQKNRNVLKDIKIDLQDDAFILYSSGTSGKPKAVELTHMTVMTNFYQCNIHEETYKEYMASMDQESTLAVLPLSHIYGLCVIFLQKLRHGYKVVTLPKFDTENVLKALDQHKITTFYGVPTIIQILGTHPKVKPHHLQYIKVFVSGASIISPTDVENMFSKAQRKFKVRQVYGMTELSPLVTIMPWNVENILSVGYALPNTKLRITDAESNNLGPNQIGELLVYGPQIMKGYKNNNEATKAAFSEDGWYKTGDIAKISEDGAVYIVDRSKDIIKVKGYQVASAEIEAVIKMYPGVAEVAVIGVPDHWYGEVPKAIIVAKAGFKLEEEDIKSFVANEVSEYKSIHDVVFVDRLPKNSTGKILKRFLREKYA